MAKKDDLREKMMMEEDKHSLVFTLDRSIKIEGFP